MPEEEWEKPFWYIIFAKLNPYNFCLEINILDYFNFRKNSLDYTGKAADKERAGILQQYRHFLSTGSQWNSSSHLQSDTCIIHHLCDSFLEFYIEMIEMPPIVICQLFTSMYAKNFENQMFI